QCSGGEVSSLIDYSDWNGAEPSASDFDVILLLMGYDYNIGMTDEAAQAIVSFVEGGGSLVVTEWAAYNAFSEYLQPEVDALLPVDSPMGGDSSAATWTVADSGHPILTGFPASWYDPAYHSLVDLRAGAESIVDDGGGTPLVSVTTASGGTVIHINHSLTYDGLRISSYAIRLMVNSVYFAAGETPPPASGDVLLLGDGGSEVYVATAFLSAGFNVVFGGFYGGWDGEFPAPENFKSIVFLDGIEFGKGFSSSASTALSEYVMGGGGLVLTEWTSYDVLKNSLDSTFASLMPVVQPTYEEMEGGEWTISNTAHPMATSLPATWTDTTSFSVVEPVEGAEVIARGPNDVPMVTEKSVGEGKVVHINHTLASDTTFFDDLGSVTPYALRLIVNAAAHTGGMSPPYSTDSGEVLLLGDGFTESEAIRPLTRAGFHVAYAGRYDSWDGMFPDPSNYKATLFLDGYYYGQGMEDSAEQALANAVSSGMGLVATEWTTYDVLQETLGATVGDLLPVFQPVYGEGRNATWTVQNASHPILEGLPTEWSDGEGLSLIAPKDSAEVLVTSGTGTPMVTTWNSPGGKVVHLNDSLTYWNGGLGPEIRQLIVNSLRFVGDLTSAGRSADFNDDKSVDSLDLIHLLTELGNGSGPADLDESGTIDSPDVYLFSKDWMSQME
ncbi:MAG: hypothetical protein KC931_15025, partial [Candidatus Omnitrophica bacterium]|nr:hypothetical protein [Candidatus Omnitrophota bacterium]